MILQYKGMDITEQVDILRCYHEMHAEGQADSLRIAFDNNEDRWDGWEPKAGDEILVKHEELSSGIMYVAGFRQEAGRYTVTASALPIGAKERKEKAWQNIRLLQIGEEIAANHGLKFKSYGVENYKYQYRLQEDESDFGFLSRLCRLEGCGFIIRSKTLILYGKEFMESREGDGLDLYDYGGYRFFDESSREYGQCEVICGKFKGKAFLSSKPAYRPKGIFLCSNTEAVRYAKNLLRHVNQELYTGYIRQEEISSLAAGSVVKLNSSTDESWNREVFITMVRNEYKAQKSKVFFRRISR